MKWQGSVYLDIKHSGVADDHSRIDDSLHFSHRPIFHTALLAVGSIDFWCNDDVLAPCRGAWSALYMRTRRLGVCIGTHVGWNYCVSQVFSSTVSGHTATEGLLRGELAGNAMLTGGAFGVEASLLTVLLISAVAVYVLRLNFASAPRTSWD